MHGHIVKNRVLLSQLRELFIPVVVVNQHETGGGLPDHLGMDAPHIQVVNTESRGLSRSRNLALRELNASWAVLCDDDVSLDLSGLNELEAHLSECPTAAPLPIVVCQLWQDPERAWRAYSPGPWSLRGWTARHVLRLQGEQHGARRAHDPPFPRALGLGSASGVVAGEEGLLLANHLRQGGEVTYLPLRLRFHPEESTGARLNSQTALSMGVVHRASFPRGPTPSCFSGWSRRPCFAAPKVGEQPGPMASDFFSPSPF